MTPFSYFVFGTGVLLEILLTYRLIRTRLFRLYPYFSLYVAYVVFVQSFFLFAVLRFAPSAYPNWYWTTSSVSIGLRFLVVWEVFRHTFPKSSPLRRMIFSKATMGIPAALIVFGSTLWGIRSYGQSQSVFLASERSLGVAQAALIMAILAVARYYQVRMGRNVWGVAIAFGMYVSLSTANAAFVDIFQTFVPYWQTLNPISLVLMLGMWTWAVWTYAPNPSMPSPAGQASEELSDWARDWERTLSTVRKVTHS